MQEVTIYQAGPLFSEADRDFHQKLKATILNKTRNEKDFPCPVNVIWPWEYFSGKEIERHGQRLIRDRCLELLSQSDMLIVLLDGPQVDDGSSYEAGWFGALKPYNPLAGIRTDHRFCGELPGARVNAMIEDACIRSTGRLFTGCEDLVGELAGLVKMVPGQ